MSCGDHRLGALLFWHKINELTARVEADERVVKPEDEEPGESAPRIVRQLSDRQRERMEVIQALLAAGDKETYRELERSAAQRLNLSVSSIQRLVRAWKKEGVAGLSWRERSDRGQSRISQDWQEYIVKTYREGNRGSRSLSPAQVAVRVKVRAAELGLENYPSHMTVYRLLKPLIAQAGASIAVWGG